MRTCLKCIVVHYANLNSSAMKQAVFKLWLVEYAVSFIRFLIYVYFNEVFAKNYMKNLSFF